MAEGAIILKFASFSFYFCESIVQFAKECHFYLARNPACQFGRSNRAFKGLLLKTEQYFDTIFVV